MIDLRKLGLPLLVVGPLLAGAAGAGGAIAVTKEKIAENARATEEVRARLEKAEEKRAADHDTITEVKADTKHLVEAIDRIEDRLSRGR